MKNFLFGLILGMLIPAAAGYCYLRFGYAPVATSASPVPFESTLAHMALHARLSKEAPAKNAPLPADESNLSQGAALYLANCAFCHGLPNQKATMAAKGMYPLPPQLFEKNEMVTDDPAGVIYWKVANGIRMTGMPGFGEMLSPAQMWQISLLLANADKLPPGTQAALSKPAAPLATVQSSSPGAAPAPKN